jgi:hypothetical protein
MNYDDFKSGREEGEIEGFEDGFKLALSKVREIVEEIRDPKNRSQVDVYALPNYILDEILKRLTTLEKDK